MRAQGLVEENVPDGDARANSAHGFAEHLHRRFIYAGPGVGTLPTTQKKYSKKLPPMTLRDGHLHITQSSGTSRDQNSKYLISSDNSLPKLMLATVMQILVLATKSQQDRKMAPKRYVILEKVFAYSSRTSLAVNISFSVSLSLSLNPKPQTSKRHIDCPKP